MENRFSRASSQRSATASDLDDALYPVYTQYRPGQSLGISTSGRRPAPSPSRDYQQARPSSPEDVFADPADSPPPSPSGSAFYSSSIVTPTPSVRRPSLSLSSRRSPSPLPGGGGTGYYQHHRISQSLTPSVRSSSSSTYGHGAPLNRSNTTGTTGTGYSTLSSIPSNLSDSTAAGVAPRWNYGGHQQNIYPESINTQGSVVPEEEDGGMDDPFADDFGIPVNDGFAPHRPPPAVVFPSGASSLRNVEPPPYTKYPDQPKPEVVGVPLRLQVSNGDSGIDVGRDEEDEEERRRRAGALAATGAVGLLAANRDQGGDGGEPDDGGGGHLKEWDEKRWMGFRTKTVLMGVAIAIVILLAVGLGVGLGVGLHHAQAPTATATVYPEPTTEVPPTSEETGPPLSSPNDTFPVIPTGTALIDPILLSEKSTSCDISAQDASSPGWFGMGASLLWSCAYDQDDTNEALTWRFERGPVNLTNMELFPSEPDFLRGAEYGEGAWGGYVVSSAEGITKWEIGDDMMEVTVNGDVVEYSGKPSWRDGTQNQVFWKIPFAFYNTTEASHNKGRKKQLAGRSPTAHELGTRSTGNRLWGRGDHPLDDSYKFGILFNKTVIIKQSTIDENIARDDNIIKSGNGTALYPGEIVWKCVWEKTLLEVEVMPDVPSTAVTKEKETHDDKDENDNGYDSDDDDHTTCSTSTTATPTMSANTSFTKTNEQHPPPTGCNFEPDCPHFDDGEDHSFPSFPSIPPPPPPSHQHNTDDFFGLKPPKPTETPTTNGNLTRKLRLKRHVERSTPTSYPLKVNIKESRPSSSRLRRLLGMDLTDPDPNGRANLGEDTGEGYVILDEKPNSKGRLRERDDSTCYCKWDS
ncbi:uncharacterized protein H6S33_006659 [Morchella sextelata]|uniref:uncharacterized protein n=1 Tax=Morchella sextelata TaxID=1174677 RepID=UPI001D044AE9|nr:uncharacterized protein H6S33_006659 [Morchella sextelata]KAH0604282.1 hypothetical protein H6S33_006659 [Morchella sextelata]